MAVSLNFSVGPKGRDQPQAIIIDYALPIWPSKDYVIFMPKLFEKVYAKFSYFLQSVMSFFGWNKLTVKIIKHG